MFHILEYLATRAEEDIGIAVLVVKFGDGAVVATQSRKCECIAVDKRFALLTVALRGESIDAVGYKLKEWLKLAFLCHILFS